MGRETELRQPSFHLGESLAVVAHSCLAVSQEGKGEGRTSWTPRFARRTRETTKPYPNSPAAGGHCLSAGLGNWLGGYDWGSGGWKLPKRAYQNLRWEDDEIRAECLRREDAFPQVAQARGTERKWHW